MDFLIVESIDHFRGLGVEEVKLGKRSFGQCRGKSQTLPKGGKGGKVFIRKIQPLLWLQVLVRI